MPHEKPTQIEERTAVQPSTSVRSAELTSDSASANDNAAIHSEESAVHNPAPSSTNERPKPQPLTDEQRMTNELQKEMESAYNRYIASLPEDSINDGVCLANHVVMYMDYINPVMERLKKKYPNLESHAIDTKRAEIYARTVLPLTEKVFSTKP